MLFFKVGPSNDNDRPLPPFDRTSNGAHFQEEHNGDEEDEWQGEEEELKEIFDRLFCAHNDGVRRILGQVITQQHTEPSEIDSLDALSNDTNKKRRL